MASVLALAGVMLAPGRASACSPSERSTYTITDVLPGPGAAGVARDAAIIVAGIPSLGDGGLFPFADVALIDAATEAAVPLEPTRWFALRGLDVLMALHPVDALAPLHPYRAEVRVGVGYGGDAALPPVVSRFTTSGMLLDPLVLNGELGLALRAAPVDLVERDGCGRPSRIIGQRRALFADVQLPVPSGGHGVYVGFLYFSSQPPQQNVADLAQDDVLEFDSGLIYDMQGTNIQAGQALTLAQEVLDADYAYAGCFTLEVRDPSGHVARVSRCLPSLSPDDVRALSHLDSPLDLSSDETVAAARVQQAADAHRDDAAPEFGCTFDPSAATRPAAWLTLCVGTLLAALARRRAPPL